jgi:glycerophosphoryl diester phosphodiesterase
VWLTADGVAVLDHDGELPDGRSIRDAPRADLPPHVPLLRELYEACGTDYELSLDVKDEDAAGEVVRVAREAGGAGQLWLCHWNWRTVASWRVLSDEVKLVDSTRRRHMKTLPEARAERMLELGIDAINLHHSDWDAEMVLAFHRADRLVLAWDTQSEEEIGRALDLGVDGVFGDHVDRILAVFAERS